MNEENNNISSIIMALKNDTIYYPPTKYSLIYKKKFDGRRRNQFILDIIQKLSIIKNLSYTVYCVLFVLVNEEFVLNDV